MSPNHHPKNKSMDAFQIRLDCLALVKKVNASQQAIAKVVDFALKYASIASDDVWDCIVSECAKSSLNNKLNILFLIDALLISIVDPVGYSSFSDSASSSTNVDHSTIAASHYLSLATRDLNKIVESVVPKDDWDSVRMNATDTQKVLTSWKRLGIFKSEHLDSATNSLHARKEALAKLPSSSKTQFSKQDTLRRIEEDRERHKRLRERVWILPAKSFADAIPQRSLSHKSLSSHNRTMITNKPSSKVVKPDSINIEFEDLWENLSDLNDDDYEKMQEVDQKWWGSSSFVQKQISMESQSDEIKRSTDDKKRQTSPPPNRWRKIGSNTKERESNKRSSYDDDNGWHSRHYSDGKYRRNR